MRCFYTCMWHQCELLQYPWIVYLYLQVRIYRRRKNVPRYNKRRFTVWYQRRWQIPRDLWRPGEIGNLSNTVHLYGSAWHHMPRVILTTELWEIYEKRWKVLTWTPVEEIQTVFNGDRTRLNIFIIIISFYFVCEEPTIDPCGTPIFLLF